MIRIRLGIHLDGAGCLTLPSRLGEFSLGPQGLLAYLELHLGLGGDWPGAADRCVSYLAALHKTVEQASGCFFAGSLAADELGTAAELLRWRDSLFLDGWNGLESPGLSARLMDLARVERHVDPGICRSIGERLRRVEQALDERTVSLDALLMVDPFNRFPVAWQRVLAKLPTQLIPDSQPPPDSSTLSQLQQGLRALIDGTPCNPVQWIDDGSVRFVRAETRLLAGRWLADVLSKHEENTLLLAEAQGEILDHLIESAGHARQGFSESSAFRPSLQVLPLALALLWEPLDIYAALEFLTHPVCPLPRFIRERFAERLSERPGLNRDNYAKVIESIREHSGEQADEMVSRIDTWLFQARYPVDQGAPIPDVLTRVDLLRNRFARRIGTTENTEQSAYIAAHHQCETVAAGLQQMQVNGLASIGPIQLRKLVSQATALGSPNPLRIPEVGSVAVAEHPGAVIEPRDTVLWWQLSTPVTPAPPRWTRSEIRLLANAGVLIRDVGMQSGQAIHEWVRPVFAARRRLILVLPPPGSEVHPLWQMIQKVIPDAPVQDLESVLVQPEGIHRVAPLDHAPLPSRRRWWQMSKPVSTASIEHYSFTSLDQCINNPFQWVLQHLAKLEPSHIRSIPDDFTLSGRVAHRVAQLLFQRRDAFQMDALSLDRWMVPVIQEVIESEAAVFLLPGRQSASIRLRDTVQRAITELRQHMIRAGGTAVESECWMEGSFRGGKLVGSADVVLHFGTGEQAVIDLKWAGMKKYPEKLANNRHLQLLIYSGLLQQNNQRSWPRYAYFILKESRLLTHDREVFADARVCAPEESIALPDLWQRMERTFEWRLQQLNNGQIEVRLEPIVDADEGAGPPADGLSLEEPTSSYNLYLNLAGWGPSR